MSMLDFLLEADAPEVDAEKEVDDVKVDEAFEESIVTIECTEDPFDRMLRVANEATMNHNAIINAVAKDELKYLRENGEEKPETTQEKVSIIDKIKELIQKALGAIRGAIVKLYDKITEWDGLDRAFIKNNEEKINKVDGYKVKGSFYTYNYDRLKANIYKDVEPSKEHAVGTELIRAIHGNGTKTYKQLIELWNNAAIKDQAILNYRKAVLAGYSAKDDEVRDAKKFEETLFNYFRNGGKKVEEMTFDASTCIYDIKHTSDLKAKIKKSYREVDDKFKGYNKEIDALKKNLKSAKPDKDGKVINKAFIACCSQLVSTLISTITTAYHAQMKAVVESNRTNKAIAKAAIKASTSDNKGSKKTSANESVSFLDSLELM